MKAETDQVDQLVGSLLAPADARPEPVAATARELTADQVLRLLERLLDQSGELIRPEVQQRLMQVAPGLAGQAARLSLDPEKVTRWIRTIEGLYRATPPQSLLACLWLMWLASLPQPELALKAWADALVARPPQAIAGIDWVVGPVLRRRDLPDGLLAGVIDGTLSDPVIAPAVLDLANFRFREKHDSVHAATGLLERLARLLPTVVQGLLRVEEGHLPPGEDAATISQNINHSVALCVALCDTLGQCGHRAGEGGLRQALGLRHRRVQTEAAAALARLEVAAGREALTRLAGEPVARLRVLAYARELGILESIPEEQRAETAIAESRLVNWLAEPARMGLAPSRTELVERRELFWPGHDQPAECLLFRYEYGGQFSSFGLVGPSVQGLLVEAAWMTADDLFAAFAGMAASHEELFTVAIDDFARNDPGNLRRLVRGLETAGFEDVRPALAGHFFGTWVLVAAARRQGANGLVAINGTPRWFPESSTGELAPELVWAIESGRRLLESFNPDNAERHD